jgi:hypothetical protein
MKMNNFKKLMKGTIYEREPEIETDHDHDHDENIPLYEGEKFYYIYGALAWPCRICKELTTIECEPDEFDKDFHYCGESPSCCP